MKELKEKLEALRRELAQQDEAWRQLQNMAARLGDAEIAVPQEVLEQIVGSTPEPAAPMVGVRA
jgi:hypothetical protein